MADIDFLKRQYYVSALGLTEAQAARMTINDLEYEFFSTALPTINGTGSPEGVVTAPIGTYYTDTVITNGAMRWAKKTGTGNTGWVCVEGETGWRSVSYADAGSPAAWSSTGWFVQFCRIGNVVYYRQTATASASWAGSSDSVYVLPSGFRPDPRAANSGGVQSRNTNTGATVFWIVSAATNSFRVQAGLAASQGSGDVSCSFVTTDGWPTSLPGTAA